MRKPTRLAELLVLVLCTTSAEHLRGSNFHRQRGTYTGRRLCKKGPPSLQGQVRSLLQCSALCRPDAANGDGCKSFKFEAGSGTCSVYRDVIGYDFDEVAVGGVCLGYQTIHGCPDGFRYLIEGNKCVQMRIGSWGWSQARDQCNNLTARSHPVVIETRNDWKLFSTYAKAEILPLCPSPIKSTIHGYWTAGIRPYVGGVRQPFQWQSFPGSIQAVNSVTTPWDSGQPNSAENGYLYCIVSYAELLLDDSVCTFSLCAMCEIDML